MNPSKKVCLEYFNSDFIANEFWPKGIHVSHCVVDGKVKEILRAV